MLYMTLSNSIYSTNNNSSWGPSRVNNTRTIHVTPFNSKNKDSKGSKTMKTTSAKFTGGDKILKLRIAKV